MNDASDRSSAVTRPEPAESGELCHCEELRRLSALSEELICTASFEGYLLGLNPSWERLLGFTNAELTARPFIELVHPDDREATLRALASLATGQPARLLVNRYLCKDGSYRYFSWNASTDREQRLIYCVGRDVTELMEEERERELEREQQARSNKILESIRKVHRMTIERNAPGPVFDLLLAEILEATDSEYGFIGEVQHGEGGRPFLRTRAISDISRSEETRSFYERNAADGLEFHNLRNLLGAVMTDGQPLIANDPSNHPRSGGLPDGHPPLEAFLGLPLMDGDGMVGMLGLANRPGGYDRELIEYLEPLMATSARLIRAFEQERRRGDAERELRLSEERWKRSVELAAHPVLLWDQERTLTYANKAALELLDSRYENIVGRSLDAIIVEPDLDHGESLRRFRENGWSHRITYLRTPSGEDRPVDLQAVDLGNGTSQGIAIDMREWVEIETRLKAATQRDNLTGLLNRRAIEDHAEVEIQRARRRATHVALVLVDIDYFKRINDAWGHLTGDVALQHVAEILSASVRQYDWVGRWGGEEFLVVLPETTEEQAHQVAERIRTNVAGQGLKSTSTGVIPMTASLGVAAVDIGATPSLRRLFERVDRALYAAKERGRNRTVIWSEDLRAA